MFFKKVLISEMVSWGAWARAGPIRAHTGPYGPIWAHMAHMGPYGPIWALYGPIWAHMGPIWAHMGPYGPIWALMGPYGPIWVLLDRSWKKRQLSVNFPYDIWTNFARFGSQNGILMKFLNDSASFLLEKLKNHVVLATNLNI